MDGKFATNVNAAYSTGTLRWRNGSKNPAEATMWLHIHKRRTGHASF